MKNRSAFCYFICIIIVLALSLNYYLKQTTRPDSPPPEPAGEPALAAELQMLQSQIDTLKRDAYEDSKRETSACRAVNDFLHQYYVSNYKDPVSRLSASSMYLTDNAIMQLYPSVNSPDKVTEELITAIRQHDPDIMSHETAAHTNTIDSITTYYREAGTYNMEVFSVFSLATAIEGSSSESSSFYLFKCSVIEDGSNYYIDEIYLKTPAIIPSYDPETMILNK